MEDHDEMVELYEDLLLRERLLIAVIRLSVSMTTPIPDTESCYIPKATVADMRKVVEAWDKQNPTQ